MSALSAEQVKALLKPLDDDRVKKDGKGFSHVEAWDIRRTMNQIFGFAQWSAEVDSMELITVQETKTKQGRDAWYVAYRARCSVMVGGASYTEWAAGDATNPVLGDAHDQAMKTAESQAFKRCCVNLGDQFGLSLYRDGSTAATVGEVIGQEHADAHRVGPWLLLMADAGSVEALAEIAAEIKQAEISSTDRDTLLKAFKDAQNRLKGVGGA